MTPSVTLRHMLSRVVDDPPPFYSPTWKPPAPRQPRPGELLWEIHGAGRWHRCELRDHGPYGIEAQIFSDTNELIARRFDTREQAIRWAEYERADLEKGGA